MIKIIGTLEIIAIIKVNIEVQHNVPNEIPAVFHNGLNYDHHFIIKELANEFEGQFECLGENTEKYKNLSIPVEKIVSKINIKMAMNLL